MTEAEWTASTDPHDMLEFLEGETGDRKLWPLLEMRKGKAKRPEAAAVRHRVHSPGRRFLPAERCRQIDGIDEGADKWQGIGEDELPNVLLSAASEALFQAIQYGVSTCTHNPDARIASWTALALSEGRSRLADGSINDQDERAWQGRVLRDLFGSLPFRPVSLDAAWQTSTVTSLAQAIYDERAFDRLPILADALEDAGCNNQEVLSHLRSGREHCRGCWPLDLVLGKE